VTKRVDAVKNVRDMGDDELAVYVRAQRRKLFELRFQQATGQVENHRQLRQVRREIARALTIERENARGLAPQEAGGGRVLPPRGPLRASSPASHPTETVGAPASEAGRAAPRGVTRPRRARAAEKAAERPPDEGVSVSDVEPGADVDLAEDVGEEDAGE
jgi:large subunit ribosomal protein L29